jgi:chemotaxis protein CheC
LTQHRIQLNEIERDALTELANLGVGRAAASLRHMAGGHVLLSVPSVEVLDRVAAAQLIAGRETPHLVAVHQQFTGDFSGHALLIFPQAESLELVRAVVGSNLPLEDIIDLEAEALAETGNVILNGFLATVANILKRTLTMSLPEVVRGDAMALFALSQGRSEEELVLFLHIGFSVHLQSIHGYIAMVMDLPSLISLKGLIGEFIASVEGPDDRPIHGNT